MQEKGGKKGLEVGEEREKKGKVEDSSFSSLVGDVLLLVVHFLGSQPLRVGGLDRLPDASHEGEGQEGSTEHGTGHQGNLGQAFERSDESGHRGASSLQHALNSRIVSNIVVDELVVDSVRVQAPSLIALLDEFFGLIKADFSKSGLVVSHG